MSEFLMLAKDHDDIKLKSINCYLASPKLDGMRCFWDGGVTKNLSVYEVPWANVDKEHKTNYMRSTGLWSRLGRPIMCPDWFTKDWPKMCLDGELIWKGTDISLGSFYNEPMHPEMFKDNHQKILSVVKKHEPRDEEWKGISLAVFDSPSWAAFTEKRSLKWKQRDRIIVPPALSFRITDLFHTVYSSLLSCHLSEPIKYGGSVTLFLLKQIQVDNMEHFENLRSAAFYFGGEGIVLRDEDSFWYPKRWAKVVKVKDSKDSEAKVIGYELGKEGLRNENRLGSLLVEWTTNVHFNIGIGFTDEERDNYSSLFPIGSLVTFKYRSLTTNGVPKEARFHRKREEIV